MRTQHLAARSRTLLAVAAAVVLAGGVLAGCGDDEVALPAPKESEARPSDDAGTGSDPDSEYCQAVAELEASDPEDLEDPAKAVEALSALGEVAPDDLREPFEVLADVVEQMGELDPDAPDYIDRTLEIILEPEVQDAADAIDEYTSEACGIDLEGDTSSDEPGGTSSDEPLDPDTGSATGDIDLEHIDEIKDGATGTWVDKLNATSILNDTDVSLSADSSDPVTVDEAMDACTTVLDALVTINPQVTVEIRNGETPVVAAPAGGTCAAV
ncbi:hypothetical protein [Dermatobacter hominis]|uniref:hypothetical protein n=1 Tax=Dermatobacter hominis TaxID=2884263 RepID=UPI001D10A902|nr:hypothetical protein [Dermatobacter hominis]UDY37746.1 hypothetical protein LH044_09440 [Dermatobacter hominis]